MSVRWAIYARISADRLDERHGVTNQEADCRGLVERRGGTVGEVFVDNDVSATKRKPRPGYERMLTAARAGEVTGIVGWHVDRLTRRPVELEGLIDLHDRHGVELATVNGDIDLATPSGRLMARQLASFASYEVEHKSERQRRRNDQRALEGRNHGGRRAYGYDPTGMTIRAGEAEVVRAMCAQMLAGVSVNAITRDLIQQGVPSAAGGRWTPTTVKRVVRSPRNAGFRVHRGEVVGAGSWPAIVDEATWRRCCAVLDDPARQHWTRDTRIRVYMLAGGMVICGRCSTGMSGRNSSSGKRGYVCPSKSPWLGCGGTRIAAEPFEDWLGAKVCARIASPESRARIAARLQAREGSTGNYATQLAADEAQLRVLGEDYAANLVPRPAFLTAAAGIQVRIDEAHRALARHLPGELPGLDVDDLAGWWQTAPLEQRRAAVAATVQLPIVVGPATRLGYSGMDVERVEMHWM